MANEVTFYLNNPPHTYDGENRPNDIVNYVSTYLKNSVSINTYLNWSNQTEATLTVNKVDLTAQAKSFNILDCNYLSVQSSPDGMFLYFWITDFSYNIPSANSVILTLKMDIWMTYWTSFKTYLTGTAFVEQRHCNRWWYNNGNINPTYYAFGTASNWLQYNALEDIVNNHENWVLKDIFFNQGTKPIVFDVFTYSFGNIVKTASGQIDEDGGSPVGLYLNNGFDNSILTNPVFCSLWLNSNDDNVKNLQYYDIVNNKTISLPSGLTNPFTVNPGLSGIRPTDKTTMASPYLIRHFKMLMPNNITIGVINNNDYLKKPVPVRKPNTTFSNDVLYLTTKFIPGPGPDTPEWDPLAFAWSDYNNNVTPPTYYYGLTQVLLYSKNSDKYYRSLLNDVVTGGAEPAPQGALPNDFVGKTKSGWFAYFPNLTYLTELNRFNKQQSASSGDWQLTYKIGDSSNPIIVIPTKLKTPYATTYETKAIRLTNRYHFNFNKQNLVNYHLDNFKFTNNNGIFLGFTYNNIITMNEAMLQIMPINYYDVYTFNSRFLLPRYMTVFNNQFESYTLSSASYNFLNQHQSVYNTSLRQAELGVTQAKFGIGASVAKAVGSVAGGALLAKKELGGKEAAGAGLGALFGGLNIAGAGFGLKSAELQKQMIEGQLEDESRQPDTFNAFGYDNLAQLYWNNYNTVDNPNPNTTIMMTLAHESYNPSTINQISKFYQLFGYEVNQNQSLDRMFTDSDDVKFGIRKYYNYWRINKITNAIKMTHIIPHFALEYFDDIFDKGVRIWNIANLKSENYKFKDYSFENWEMNIVKYLK